jgi:hypothetical protein
MVPTPLNEFTKKLTWGVIDSCSLGENGCCQVIAKSFKEGKGVTNLSNSVSIVKREGRKIRSSIAQIDELQVIWQLEI